MPEILKLRGKIQSYSWGSTTALAELLGRPPSGAPEAELWMGTHPRAPSEVFFSDRWAPIGEALGLELPFLFKVLAVAAPLSIQAHPNREQAVAGCRAEDERGIPRDAPERSYRDDQPKPELVYALTPFTMLRGLRHPAEILELAGRLGLGAVLAAELAPLRQDDVTAALATAVRSWMELDEETLAAALEAVAEDDSEAATWVRRLAAAYPGDGGALAPLFLNLRTLRTGEAVFTGAGVLHAYLEGLAVELMTNSDNVLRGGLTPKHRDAAELLRVLRFVPDKGRRMEGVKRPGETRFTAAEARLELAVLEPRPGAPLSCRGRAGSEILLCVEGAGTVATEGRGAQLAFARGEAFLIPAPIGAYRVEGEGRLFRASSLC